MIFQRALKIIGGTDPNRIKAQPASNRIVQDPVVYFLRFSGRYRQRPRVPDSFQITFLMQLSGVNSCDALPHPQVIDESEQMPGRATSTPSCITDQLWARNQDQARLGRKHV